MNLPKMKTKLVSLSLLAIGLNACGQKLSEANVPAPVKVAFAKQFPKADKAKWEMDDKIYYEANFHQDGIEWSAKYDANAAWMETEHKVKPEALPEPVRAAIVAKYADHKMGEAEVAETPKGTVYEVELKKAGHEMEVAFSADGTVLKTEEEKGEKDGKD
jgi:uncharacterized membrane protein YkoI